LRVPSIELNTENLSLFPSSHNPAAKGGFKFSGIVAAAVRIEHCGEIGSHGAESETANDARLNGYGRSAVSPFVRLTLSELRDAHISVWTETCA
jgi:hypothetical protein